MNDQSPPMTLAPVQPQNTGTWPTSMNPSFANKMPQMREDGMPCDICGGPEHPPMDHPFLPRMPNDPMAMTQQPQMPMAPLPMQQQQPPMQPPMQQPPQQPPMQPHPAQTQTPGQNEGGMGSGQYPHGGGGGAMQAPSGGGQSGGGGDGGEGGGLGQGGLGGGGKPPPGPIMSFETHQMNETIFKQLIDRKVGCGCRKSKNG